MIGVEEVIKKLKCSKSKAYLIIKSLNDKRIKEDGLPKKCVISGKIPKEYFEKFF